MMKNKEQILMRDGKLYTIMLHKEEDKAHKLMEKEQRATTSTPTCKALLLVHRFISLNYFIQYSISQNLGVSSKVTTLEMENICFL